MSIDEQGFLSDDIVQYRDQIRQQYAQYFDFIHRVNAFCQEAKFRINGTSANAHNRMAVRLIIKLLADTQGAVLLVERGLASQARTLLRTACETCIILGKLRQNPQFHHVLSAAEELTQVRWLKDILTDKSPSLNTMREYYSSRGITLEKLGRKEKALKDSGANRIKISSLAQDTGLSGLYYSAYELYCADTHASPYVLDSYSKPDKTGDFEDICPGPVMDNLEDVLLLIPRLMLLSFSAMNEIIALNLDADFDSLVTELRALENPQGTQPPFTSNEGVELTR
jgi:Family of unknown function (DUF5677)